MKNKQWTTLMLAQGGLIAALYVALTLIFAPISYGEVQLRVAEALTILPLFTPAAIPGLFVGCIIANLLGGGVMLDVILGSIATLIGAIGGWMLKGNRWLVPIPAIVANAILIPIVLKYGYGLDFPFILEMGYIALGEIGGCYILGELLASALMPFKHKLFKQ